LIRKIGITIAAIILTGFVLIQLIPGPPRDNPPVLAPARFPPDLEPIMRDACMNCHSNETEWPWYSAIAPASWYVGTDVLEARASLNFSNWEAIPFEQRLDLLTRLWNGVVEGRMPHHPYVLMHPRVELDVEDRKAIRDWAFDEIESLTRQIPPDGNQ
jgi:hypothetical protein